VGFVVGFSGMVVALLLILGRRMIDERRAATQATLRSARLELELLKRGIQPHFLMNVLTSILEWIEQEPARASRFVLALADELSLLTRASAHALIPIELELELCRAHVALMSQRLEVEVSLSVPSIDPAEQVPPALFHTLIENAMTHGCFAEGPVRLTLDAERAGTCRRYRFVSPEVAPLPASREGTGSRYLRARLQESYGGRWRVRAGPCATGWETVIEIEDA
jgi:LytS/YehU family sensor histidine kinase